MKKSRALELGKITEKALAKMYMAIGDIYTMANGASVMGMTDTGNMLAAIAGELQLAKADLNMARGEFVATVLLQGALSAD